MKTKFILSLLLSFCFYLLSSQVPQGFNYQAIARDGSGNPIVNVTIQVKLTVKPDSSGTGIIWEEIHNPVTTNAYGLFTVVLGKGTRQTGSVVNNFGDIDWSVTPKFLKTDIFYNSAWKFMGTTRLYSVPYALMANDLGGTLDKLKVRDNGTNPIDSALFEVRNKNGQIVFAVYNEGVRIYVEDGVVKGTTKGGFAIGGFGTAKGTSQPLFVVDPDSIRAYIGTNPAKGVKGGFAIGGFSTNKAPGEEYLRVTRDSTRVYLNNTLTKGVKGGFAIGGFDKTKGTIQDFLKVSKDSTSIKTNSAGAFTVANYQTGAQGKYLNLMPDNYFIGHQAGNSITYGRYNFFLGYKAGFSTTGIWPVGRNEGSYNSFIGYQAGYSNTTGMFNLFIGHQAGYSNIGSTYWDGNYNSFLGYKSGFANTTGYGNVFLGYNTGLDNISGSLTVAIGYEAGKSNNASNNVFVGSSTGYYNTTGTANAFIGAQAGWKNTTGNYNVFIGSVAGVNNTTGQDNIYIGDHAGYNITNGTNNVIMGYLSGMNLTNGSGNVFLGDWAGINYDQGHYNIFIGSGAGYGGTTGDALGRENIALGWGSGYSLTTGTGNICLGSASGNSITAANDNIFLGRRSGYFETTSNNFCIDVKQRTDINDQKAKALFYGNFDLAAANQFLRINAHVGINGAGSSSYAVYVTGSGYITGTWTAASDVRYKKSISPLSNTLAKVMDLDPVSYSWRREEFPEMNFDNETHLGFIAQEMEKSFPELVKTDEKGFKSIAYDKITVILIQAVQEQQKIIEEQNERIGKLEKMQSRIDDLERALNRAGNLNN